MGTTEKLKDQVEALGAVKDREALKSDIDAITAPWWRNAKTFAQVGAGLSVLVTVLAGLMSSCEKYWTLKMQEAKQSHDIATQREKQTEDIRNAYLDRLKDSDSRQRTLRFLSMTAADEKVRIWAQSELVIVEKETKKIEADLADARREADEARKAAHSEAQKAKANAAALFDSRRKIGESDLRVAELERKLKTASCGPIQNAADLKKCKDECAVETVRKELRATFGGDKTDAHFMKASLAVCEIGCEGHASVAKKFGCWN